MSTLVLKTYTRGRLLETYVRRTPSRIAAMLRQPEFNNPGACDPWGEPLDTPDMFTLHSPKNVQVFKGNVGECIAFLRGCR